MNKRALSGSSVPKISKPYGKSIKCKFKVGDKPKATKMQAQNVNVEHSNQQNEAE